jgi:hypothetical protein
MPIRFSPGRGGGAFSPTPTVLALMTQPRPAAGEGPHEGGHESPGGLFRGRGFTSSAEIGRANFARARSHSGSAGGDLS